MNGLLELFRAVVDFISSYQFVTAFVAGFIYEEFLAITTAVTARGDISIFVLFVFGFLGIIASDIFWFYFIRIKPLFKAASRFSKFRKDALRNSRFSKFPPPTKLHAYILTKMFYGLRTWGIFYVSFHGMKFWKFMKYTTIATLIWMTIFIPLAWLVGSGIYLVFDITKSVGLIVGLVFILFIIWGVMGQIFLKIIGRRRY